MQLHFSSPEITKSVMLFFCSILFLFQMVACSNNISDLAFINGKIWTGTSTQHEATAVVVSGEKIVFVGSDQDAKKWIDSSTKVIDLKGRLLLPGFNDAHVHFSDGGFSLIELNLRDAKTREEFAEKIKNYIQTISEGTWITGGNWDHESWPDQKYPDKWLIDPVSENTPILVNRLDGHVAVANSLALKIAKITKDTPDPEGGFIEKDPRTGEPTGILKDTAMGLVSKYIPAPPDSVRLKAIKAALQHSAELGITSVQDVSPISDYPFYEKLLGEEKLSCRINAVFPIENYTKEYQEKAVVVHSGTPMLRIGSLKCFSDGSMGAGSALFFEPYSDDPSTSGLGIYTKDKITELIVEAHKNNLQVYTHAIGDKANQWVLDAYEEAIKKYGKKDLRHRIEHAQVVTNEDLPRFSELNVIASIQPAHCIDDMRWAEKRIGKERSRNSYMFKSFSSIIYLR